MAESRSAESLSAVCLCFIPCPCERTIPQLQANKPKLRSPPPTGTRSPSKTQVVSNTNDPHRENRPGAGSSKASSGAAIGENAWSPTNDRTYGPWYAPKTSMRSAEELVRAFARF